MFSVLISGVKFLLIGLRNALMGSYIFSILYKRIHFIFSSLKRCNTQNGWATHQILSVPDVKNKKSLNPILYYTANFLG